MALPIHNTQCHWAVHISVVKIALCVFCHKNFKNQPDMVECACHLAVGFGVSGHFQLQSEFEVHLGYMRYNLKKMRGGEEGRGGGER